MKVIGHIEEIWRYPVKSMGGEMLDASLLKKTGIPGDRQWALFSEPGGQRLGGKPVPALLNCHAVGQSSASDGTLQAVEIELPNGNKINSDDADASEMLSQQFGRAVSLRHSQIADGLTRKASGLEEKDFVEKLNGIAKGNGGIRADDLQSFPEKVLDYAIVPGSHFDLAPVHLLSTQTLERFASARPDSDWNRRRFRANFVIRFDPSAGAQSESDWLGRRIRIGGASLICLGQTQRCAVVTREQGKLPEDAEILQTLNRDANRNLGIYAVVSEPGLVKKGDEVAL